MMPIQTTTIGSQALAATAQRERKATEQAVQEAGVPATKEQDPVDGTSSAQGAEISDESFEQELLARTKAKAAKPEEGNPNEAVSAIVANQVAGLNTPLSKTGPKQDLTGSLESPLQAAKKETATGVGANPKSALEQKAQLEKVMLQKQVLEKQGLPPEVEPESAMPKGPATVKPDPLARKAGAGKQGLPTAAQAGVMAAQGRNPNPLQPVATGEKAKAAQGQELSAQAPGKQSGQAMVQGQTGVGAGQWPVGAEVVAQSPLGNGWSSEDFLALRNRAHGGALPLEGKSVAGSGKQASVAQAGVLGAGPLGLPQALGQEANAQEQDLSQEGRRQGATSTTLSQASVSPLETGFSEWAQKINPNEVDPALLGNSSAGMLAGSSMALSQANPTNSANAAIRLAKNEVTGHVVKGAMSKDRLSSESLLGLASGIQAFRTSGPGQAGAPGTGEIHMRMKPDNLGELTLKVSTRGNDVHLQIRASDETSRRILEESLTDLKDKLSGQNLNLSRVEVTIGAPLSGAHSAQNGSLDLNNFQSSSNAFSGNEFLDTNQGNNQRGNGESGFQRDRTADSRSAGGLSTRIYDSARARGQNLAAAGRLDVMA